MPEPECQHDRRVSCARSQLAIGRRQGFKRHWCVLYAKAPAKGHSHVGDVADVAVGLVLVVMVDELLVAVDGAGGVGRQRSDPRVVIVDMRCRVVVGRLQ